jgi:hypothetical protein
MWRWDIHGEVEGCVGGSVFAFVLIVLVIRSGVEVEVAVQVQGDWHPHHDLQWLLILSSGWSHHEGEGRPIVVVLSPSQMNFTTTPTNTLPTSSLPASSLLAPASTS